MGRSETIERGRTWLTHRVSHPKGEEDEARGSTDRRRVCPAPTHDDGGRAELLTRPPPGDRGRTRQTRASRGGVRCCKSPQWATRRWRAKRIADGPSPSSLTPTRVRPPSPRS